MGLVSCCSVSVDIWDNVWDKRAFGSPWCVAYPLSPASSSATLSAAQADGDPRREPDLTTRDLEQLTERQRAVPRMHPIPNNNDSQTSYTNDPPGEVRDERTQTTATRG